MVGALLVLAPSASAAERSGTKRCPVAPVRDAGPGRVLGLSAERAGCGEARRLVAAYQRCLDARCYTRIRRRCVQPEFLGRCRAHDRFFRRTLRGYHCTERRAAQIRRRYDGTVTCVRGRRRVDHRYTLFTGRSVAVGNERELRAAWANPRLTAIRVTRDMVLRACRTGDPIRESSTPVSLDGGGHTLRQGCFEKRLLRQDGTGFVELKNVTLTRGGSDGPGGAVTTRGEIRVVDSKVQQNLAEEPGGGIMSQRRATIIRSVITGNLANDDGGGVYARRGGIQVYDSIVSANLVDGSGGGLGSTGDILVVRSHMGDAGPTDLPLPSTCAASAARPTSSLRSRRRSRPASSATRTRERRTPTTTRSWAARARIRSPASCASSTRTSTTTPTRRGWCSRRRATSS